MDGRGSGELSEDGDPSRSNNWCNTTPFPSELRTPVTRNHQQRRDGATSVNYWPTGTTTRQGLKRGKYRCTPKDLGDPQRRDRHHRGFDARVFSHPVQRSSSAGIRRNGVTRQSASTNFCSTGVRDDRRPDAGWTIESNHRSTGELGARGRVVAPTIGTDDVRWWVRDAVHRTCSRKTGAKHQRKCLLHRQHCGIAGNVR